MNLSLIFLALGVLIMSMFAVSVHLERARKRAAATQSAMSAYHRALRSCNNALHSDPAILTNAVKQVIYERMARAQAALVEKGIAIPKNDRRTLEDALVELNTQMEATNSDLPSLPNDEQGRKLLSQHAARTKMFLQNEVKQRAANSNALSEAIYHVSRIELGLNLDMLIERGGRARERGLLGASRDSFETARDLLNKHATLANAFKSHLSIIEQNLQRIKDAMLAERESERQALLDTSNDGLPDFAFSTRSEKEAVSGGNGLDRMFGDKRAHWD